MDTYKIIEILSAQGFNEYSPYPEPWQPFTKWHNPPKYAQIIRQDGFTYIAAANSCGYVRNLARVWKVRKHYAPSDPRARALTQQERDLQDGD